MDFVSTLSVLATVTSFAIQLIGMEMSFRIVQKGSTADVAPAPFIAFFVSACVWLKYGLMMGITSVILTSCLSAVLQFLYICIYYLYTNKKHFLHRLLLIGLFILFTPLMYVDFYETEVELASRHLGLYCCVLSVMCYASPMATLSEVLRHKSTDSISLPLCLINFVSAVEWTLYGLAIQDKFVTFPNFIGGVLGILQLSLFVVYGFKHKRGRPSIVNT
ncbi:sugar transporter SWEET1 [Aplysia californica]|uniref:Sugar transporter SWEET1 n=1 Tax=Aplysia californica TaxID=6500 RepID=A0ABM0ZZZ9_APLCA|nr:sugar transporter SWEET1 [Aplysia californica]